MTTIPYIPNTEQDKKAMLEAIGVASSDELFRDIPENLRNPAFALPPPLSEAELLAEMKELTRLKDDYDLLYQRSCMHEVVISAVRQHREGVKALDVAKRLIDYGSHSPTMYFPLVVEEALMIEPTETESKETLDAFVEAMKVIAHEAVESPQLLKEAPHNTPNSRLDEARAACKPDLR